MSAQSGRTFDDRSTVFWQTDHHVCYVRDLDQATMPNGMVLRGAFVLVVLDRRLSRSARTTVHAPRNDAAIATVLRLAEQYRQEFAPARGRS